MGQNFLISAMRLSELQTMAVPLNRSSWHSRAACTLATAYGVEDECSPRRSLDNLS
jgi:hypothetical protein